MVYQIVIVNDTIPTSLLRVTIKTLTKIFDFVDPDIHLKNGNGEAYNPEELIDSLVNLQIDDHSNTIDTQELIWDSIQKLILHIHAKIETTQATKDQTIEFFFR